jgi:hypothetical protein
MTVHDSTVGSESTASSGPKTGTLLAPPQSFAAQILTVTARVIELNLMSPFGLRALDEDVRTAIDAVLGKSPDAVAADSESRARHTLPPIGPHSRCQYAALLRETARRL